MNDLEFIEQFIKGTELTLNTYIQLQAEELSHPNIYDKSIEITKKELQHLQQIKAKLEAWEIVNNKLNLKVQTEEAVTEGLCMKGYWLLVEQYPYTQTTILEQEEYDILKKALEVKNDK